MSQNIILKDLVLERCSEIEADLSPGISQNKKLANIWGKVHIITGLLATFCSSLSAALTFSNSKIAVVVFAVLSAILASGLTFLNPSAREAKRRAAESRVRSEINRLGQDRILLMAPSATEQMMIDKLSEITKRSEDLMKELIEFL